MTRSVKWAVLAAAAGALLATAAPAAAADGAGHPGAAAAVANHTISGTETAISCMTAARCVAVGGGPKGGQVVSLYNGRAVRVTVLRWRAPLTSVSCAGRAGCWAIGPVRGTGQLRLTPIGVVLARIGPTGNVTRELKISVPKSDELSQIWCRSMTACQILGQSNKGTSGPTVSIFFSPWNGKRWRLDSVGGLFSYNTSVAGFSCWQATCVVVGWERLSSSQGEAFAWTFRNGVAGAINLKGLMTTFKAVSCVSASTCYAVGVSHGAGVAVTISHGVPSATSEPEPDVTQAIECVRSVCRATGGDVILTLTGGVVTGTPLTDTATTRFDDITSRGNGFAAVGAAPKRGESAVVIG